MHTLVFFIKVVHPNGREDYFLERPERNFSDPQDAVEMVQQQMQRKEPQAHEIIIRGYIRER